MSISHDQRSTEIGAAVANAFRKHSTAFVVEGIILVLLGMLAIFVPLFATTPAMDPEIEHVVQVDVRQDR